MFFCNKHFGMYQPATVRSHDGILGQYFCAVSFFVVAGKLVYAKSEQSIDYHCKKLSTLGCTVISYLQYHLHSERKKVLKN